MNPYRMRILVADEPGRLGDAATALSDLGVNILDVDVQSEDGRLWADDLLIDLTIPIDPTTIDHVLGAIGITVTDMRPADAHEIVDATVRCLDVASGLASSPATGDAETDDARLRTAVRQVVHAELAWLTPQRLMAVDGVTGSAMVSGKVRQEREWVKLLPNGRQVWALAVPFEDGDTRRVLTLLRGNPRFSFTETARVQAMLRLIGTLHADRPPHRVQPGSVHA